MLKTHELKTWPDFFRKVVSGEKPFEIRVNDREYEVGDTVVLREFDPAKATYSGSQVVVLVTYLLIGGQFGIQPGWVIMGIKEK